MAVILLQMSVDGLSGCLAITMSLLQKERRGKKERLTKFHQECIKHPKEGGNAYSWFHTVIMYRV